MKFYAHSENNEGKKHGLAEHLKQTALLAESFSCEQRYKDLFKMTGMLHDFGKYQPDFQAYLVNGGKRGSVPHASWGAGLARSQRMIEASIVIDGHHKGLPDNAAWKADTEPYIRGEIQNFDRVKDLFNEEMGGEFEKKIDKIVFRDSFQRESVIRYLFSVLTDADWLSTEKHFNRNVSELRSNASLSIDEMLERLEGELLKKSTEGEINRLRNEAREEVLLKAELPQGFYSLSLPTGMGKTLTSIAWALRHAKQHHLKRIIVVLPYINIIDQTAQVLKDVFGEELVLEHHTSFNEGQPDGNEDYSVSQKRKQIACENWDFPIVVTTTVQFFESLFSNKPSKCRKIHNIAESVVIFDEIQALPKEVILPTIQMLKDTQMMMKISYLFCTATQPAFEKRLRFDGIESINPLIADPSVLYEKTKRVEYSRIRDLEPVDCETLLELVKGKDCSALVIFNTKKDALGFFNALGSGEIGRKLYHLSTSMCPMHRKSVINNVRHDLHKKKKILLIATQLIEAGVDFDFPCVFRAMAPLESIIQSAGRCNREGKMNGYGDVFLFKLKDSGMPDPTYAACAGHAEAFLDRLHGHEVFNEYYAQVVNLYIDPDKYHINEARKKFNFETVNDGYRIIRNQTEGLYIYNYGKESRELLHTLEHKEFLSRDDYRKMQRYTVQVYNRFLIQNSAMYKMMSQGFLVWYGNYDKETGISILSFDADKLVV